jgi:hypothetical protein
LDALVGEYSHHVWEIEPDFEFDVPAAQLYITDQEISFVSAAGKEFKIKKEKLSDFEKKIFKNNIGIKIFLVAMVDTWHGWKWNFSDKNLECPPELYYFGAN